MLKITVFTLFLLFSGDINAGEQFGKVDLILVSSKSLSKSPTRVKLVGNLSNPPLCNTSRFWAIDTDTEAGKNMLDVLLMAYSMDKSVRIWGDDKCILKSDAETAIQVAIGR